MPSLLGDGDHLAHGRTPDGAACSLTRRGPEGDAEHAQVIFSPILHMNLNHMPNNHIGVDVVFDPAAV
jgi:hypothetical protein